MSSKNIKELRALSEAEMDDKMIALKQKLIESRLLAASGRLEKPSVLKNAKKEIARILTLKGLKNAGNK